MALVPCLHQHRVRGRGRSKQPAVGERPFPHGHEVRDGEMAALASIGGVGESSALGRNVFAVKRVVFPIAEMAVPHRRRLRKRLWSELDAVRDLLSKAELYSRASGAVSAAASAGKKDGRLYAPGAPAAAVEGDGCRAAKRRKASPFAERRTRALKSKQDDRERLAGRLASMAAALPDHAVAFLQDRRRRVGGADDSRVGDGDIEMDDGALFQLKMLLDKFAPECTPKRHGDGGRRRAPLAAASGGSQAKRQEEEEAGGDRMLPPVQEEEEEGINICGGVARIAIRDIAGEYGELVNDIGFQLLSPLQRKYVDLAEQDEYVDICGDASPVVFPAKTGGDDSSRPSVSDSSDSDTTSSSTDSDSSRSSPEALPKENSPEVDPPTPIQGKHNTPVPAAEPEENQCAATVFAITKIPIAATVLPKECRTHAQPPPSEQAPEKGVAPAATVPVHHNTGGAPPPAVLPIPNENVTNSQPAPVLVAPVAAQIAEPQPQQIQNGAAPRAQTQQTNDLIAMARQEGKRRAMAKARQEILELERAVLPDDRIHPRDMELLGIAAFEHVVSTVRDARTAQLHIWPGFPSILQQLGLFLKADSGGEEEDEEEQPPPLLVVSHGEDMEIEDGQIL